MKPIPSMLAVIGVSAAVAIVVTNASLFVEQNGTAETSPNESVTAQTTTTTNTCVEPRFEYDITRYSWNGNPANLPNNATPIVGTGIIDMGNPPPKVVQQIITALRPRALSAANAACTAQSIPATPACASAAPTYCAQIAIGSTYTSDNPMPTIAQFDVLRVLPNGWSRVRYKEEGTCAKVRRCRYTPPRR